MQPRRRSLKIAAIAFAVLAIGGGGLAFWGARRPHVDLVSDSCPAEPQGKFMILVTYASRCGSTAEVAQAIANSLCEIGLAAEVEPVTSVTSLERYRAVIIGSAVRYGKWLPEALDFIKRNRARLAQVPVAIFSMHMGPRGTDGESQDKRLQYAKDVRSLVTPKAEVFFAGKIDPSRLSVFERLVVRAVKSPIADLRDWQAIRTWSAALPGELQLAAVMGEKAPA